MAERRGRDLERLVKALETLSQTNEDFLIESPAYLQDRDTGQRREIDVLLTHRCGNRKTRIAFECKDHSTKIDVPKIEAFSSKCDSLDVDLRIMVSSSGYFSNCIPKAAAKGVLLHTVEQSVNFDWQRNAGLLEDIAIFREINIVDGNNTPLRENFFMSASGERVQLSDFLDSIFCKVITRPELLISYSDKVFDLKMKMNEFAFKILGMKHQIPSVDAGKNLTITVYGKFHFHRQFSTFGFFSYKTTIANRQFAVAQSALRIDDKITSILVEATKDDIITVFGANSNESSNARVFRRLVSWDNLEKRLLEVGPRHHINLAATSDTLTATAFLYNSDEGLGNWDGFTDAWPNLKEDGVFTISFYDKHKVFRQEHNFPK